MLEPKNVIDVVDFNIFHNLFVVYFSLIQPFLSLETLHTYYAQQN
jgi:hypothetical protein